MKTKRGSVVLITGASSGLGKITALQLAKEGYVVYAGARRVELMEKDLKPKGIHVLNLDVCDDNSMQSAVKKIIDEQGRIDVLINNAGYGLFGAIEDVAPSEARRQFDVNVFGLARLTQIVAPHMREQKFGKIINMSALFGFLHFPFSGWYCASKYAVEALSDCLRLELKPFGVDVVVIEPGRIKTGFIDVVNKKMNDKAPQETVYSPLMRKMEEIGKNMKDGPSNEPKLIADVISKSLKANKPKTRYVAGQNSFILPFLKKILSDRGYDKVVRSLVK